MKERKKRKEKLIKWSLLTLIALLMFGSQNRKENKNTSLAKEIFTYVEKNIYVETLKTHMPVVMDTEHMERSTLWDYFKEKLSELLPVQDYILSMQEYDTEVESALSYDMLMAREGLDEQFKDGEQIAVIENSNGEQITDVEKSNNEQMPDIEKSNNEQMPDVENSNGEPMADEKNSNSEQNTKTSDAKKSESDDNAEETLINIPTVTEPVVQISREKLKDFDYLIQNFYTVDMTTTINSSQLNIQELLEKNLKLQTTADKPQILIHHTHSQERYADSTEDDATSIIGVGAYLANLLREQYGYNVIHDTGEYDVIDHDNAYAYAGPAVEKILAENPSIEVVIDMHRDGIGSGHLISEVNGKQTAKIMFFNGLSRTTANGELDYLHNPYLMDNLAFSLQMKIAAEEYYPGFTRPNYLKGYRYNLHYCPKSMLVEVGAQTNTVQEAMNAMEPLADLLHKVLGP